MALAILFNVMKKTDVMTLFDCKLARLVNPLSLYSSKVSKLEIHLFIRLGWDTSIPMSVWCEYNSVQKLRVPIPGKVFCC